MNRLLPIIVCCLLSACSPKKDTLPTVTDLLSEDGYWKLAGAESFMDGGSFCLSFCSESGDVVHLFVLANNLRKDGKLQFVFCRNYDLKNGVPIQEGSELEEKAIWLLDNFHERPEIQISKDEAVKMKYALLNRRGESPFKVELDIKTQAEPSAPPLPRDPQTGHSEGER